ncbi:DevR family CRISPR-associated autoregulator [Chondromyces crocatus]|uniref:CRISPR-associated protein n=1 Tax=Chondromyces crocatus TaxID=52 RepID=A0A0K1ECB2_CHOCO|nr:DevR family CRISPR-associated autoregulator [Chondromyces crocatus]AKT38510.1 CRISPR-associated protein [Chondromyces crocatus]
MSHVTGSLIIDAPASALNNAGKDEEARTDNAVAVKFIRAPEGRYPYVSAQAVRYWLRTQLAASPGWSASPVFRETKVAYTDAEPTLYDEDDLFGYMRATSKSTDEKKAAKRAEIAARSTPVDPEVGEVTRISPLRIGTLVAITPTARLPRDFGTMARAEGDPVPHEHQFYRAHLKAPFALDLTAAGTFFVSQRVGYKNLDKNRIDSAKKAGATALQVRGFSAHRLPLPLRRRRVAQVFRTLGRLEGGAKQTLHLTDTAPAALILAVTRSGNQPFQRVFSPDPLGERTTFRADVLEEALRVYRDDFLSGVYIGWSRGFLDSERQKLDTFLASAASHHGIALHVGHPREMADAFAAALESDAAAPWFD